MNGFGLNICEQKPDNNSRETGANKILSYWHRAQGFLLMALYFFDTVDGDEVITDEIGLEFPDFEAAKFEAARGLADLARDVLPGSERRELSIHVRDEQSRPLFTTRIVFEIVLL